MAQTSRCGRGGLIEDARGRRTRHTTGGVFSAGVELPVSVQTLAGQARQAMPRPSARAWGAAYAADLSVVRWIVDDTACRE